MPIRRGADYGLIHCGLTPQRVRNGRNWIGRLHMPVSWSPAAVALVALLDSAGVAARVLMAVVLAAVAKAVVAR